MRYRDATIRDAMDDPQSKPVPLCEDRLTPASREFFRALVDWRPAWRQLCEMERRTDEEDFDLRAVIPSPTADPERSLIFWVSQDDLSLAFGPWHTHGQRIVTQPDGTWKSFTLLETAKQIIANQLGYLVERDVHGDVRYFDIIDVADPDAILAALTDPYSAGRISVRSWDGQLDQELDVRTMDDG